MIHNKFSNRQLCMGSKSTAMFVAIAVCKICPSLVVDFGPFFFNLNHSAAIFRYKAHLVLVLFLKLFVTAKQEV